MDNRQYISILTTGTGSYTLDVETLNAATNVSFSITTAGSANDDEMDMSQRLEAAITTVLTNTSADVTIDGTTTTIALLYSGEPVFTGDSPLPSFNVTRTGHCVCLWSQAQFRVQLTENNTGNQIVIGSDPVLSTLQEFEDMATIRGVDLETPAGTALTTAQKVLLLKTISSQMVSYLRNPLVLSTYLQAETGNYTQGIRLKKTPVVSYNNPRTRYPLTIWSQIASTLVTASDSYDLNYKTGWIKWRQHSKLFNTKEPFALSNEIKVTYVAGYMDIPFIIKEKLVSLAGLLVNEDELGGGIVMLAGGTGRVQYDKGGTTSTLTFILNQLNEYKL